MPVTIYGRSDDLIEVEGDINEEFGCYDADDGIVLAFSDGTALRVTYGANAEGFWRITPLGHGTATYSKVEATDERYDYSDRVTLDGDIAWVVFGTQIARRAKEATS